MDCVSRCLPLYKHLLTVNSTSKTTPPSPVETATYQYYYPYEQVGPSSHQMGKQSYGTGGRYRDMTEFESLIDKEIEERMKSMHVVGY